MVETRVLTGPDVAAVLDDVARLRIAVFRDWPYLYDGDLGYERDYLRAYQSPGAVVVVAQDGGRVVGASTGAPMQDHASDFAAAFAARPEPMDRIFYCAESVLLPDYRGQNLGRVFFHERETHARRMGHRWSAFCSVVRPDDHPLRPADYHPLDRLWRGLGYAPLPGAVAQFEWQDIDQPATTAHPLQFWMKAL